MGRFGEEQKWRAFLLFWVLPHFSADPFSPAPRVTFMDIRTFACRHCSKSFKTNQGFMSHLTQKPLCRNALAEYDAAHPPPPLPPLDDFDMDIDDPPEWESNDAFDHELGDDLDTGFNAFDVFMPPDPLLEVEPPVASPQPQPPPPPRAHIPNINDTFDSFKKAGRILREEEGTFKRWAREHGDPNNPYHPFKSKLEWDIARWAKLEGPGASSFDRLMAFDSVSPIVLLGVLGTQFAP